MNKFLPYQLIGKDYDVMTPHDPIKKNKSKQDESEKSMIDEIIPAFYHKQRAFSIPKPQLPRQIQITNLYKKLSNLRQDLERINIELIRNQSFRYNIRNPKTVFERHFQNLQEQLKIWEAEKLKITEQIKQVKNDIYVLENQSDIYQSKKNLNNKSVFLNQLVVIEKKGTSTKQLPKIRSHNNSMYSYKYDQFPFITQQEQSSVHLIDSVDEVDALHSYNKLAKIVQQLPSQPQQITDEIVLEINGQLQAHKTVLRVYRMKKYEKYYTTLPNLSGQAKRKLKKYFLVVLFSLCLIKETKQSQQKYQVISHKFQKANFTRVQKELQYFINNTIMRHIAFKVNRQNQLQKQEGKMYKFHIPSFAEEICKEILFRLFNHQFSSYFYNYLYSISQAGYYPLNNFHCQTVRAKFELSEYFHYFSKENKKLVIFDFIIVKNIIFFGLFTQTRELLAQFKMDSESEIIHTIAILFFELFLKTYDTSILYVNLKHFSNSLSDGPHIQQELKQIDLIKIKLLSDLPINNLVKPFHQMLDKQVAQLVQQK